ncbi:major facilitator superfamily domain-containing protein [Fennellomyces sp. T-0311]|nr:major facilitator superfamily domain-containing protein [Fennellomyces sp. T-0311]
MPSVHQLMEYFDTDLTVMNATIALYILAMAIMPLFWAPFSERIGRRPVYIMSMGLFTVATVICGVARNLTLFFVFRIIQGASASAGLTVGGGSVADMFKLHQRGRAMSLFVLGTILGPTFAPLIGGYVGQYLGWRWIFYISTMIGGVIFAADVFIMRETLYRPSYEQEEKAKTLTERIADLKFDPFSGFLLLLRPDVLLMSIPMSVSFGWFFFLVSELSPTYSEVYSFDQGSLGLLYMTGGIGNSLGSLIGGFVTDKYYIYLRSKSEGGVVKLEKRLPPIFFGLPLIVAGNLMYGWFLYARLHWFTPLVGYLIMSTGTMFTVIISTNFLVESYLQNAASLTAIVSCTRNLVSTIFTLVGAAARAGLGDGWV